MTCQAIASVLVVDDDPLLCEVAASYFRNSGASHISVAHDGCDALDFIEARSDPVDFILLDLKMPNMDGVQFLRHMHQRGYRGPIGIVSGEGPVISSLAMELAKKCGLNVVGYLNKPLTSNGLAELISASQLTQRSTTEIETIPLTALDLKLALEEQQIVAHYQPQIDARSGAVAGVEALARWLHPERGIVPPDQFVPLAEDNGLMPALTDQMVANVIGDIDMLNWVDPKLTVSINLGAAALNDTGFPDKMSAMVDQSGLDRDRFILELTESKLVEDSIDSIEVLARLDLAGFDLSLDDFGTQFSNIEQLAKYPFKELKIDRSFVCAAATDDRSKAMVESCSSLAKQLGLRIVAEGIETATDRDLLVRLGVDILQGYYFAKPMAVDDLVEWAKSYRLADNAKPIAACM